MNEPLPNNTDGGADQPRRLQSGRLSAVLEWIIRAWAIYFGGGVLLALVTMITLSAVLNLLTDKPLLGDYDLTQHFMAIAIASFLPYCQLVGANITVDIFTEGLSPRAKAWMALVASVLALIFSLMLLRQTYFGMLDLQRRVQVTGILAIPLWTAFPPILVSVFLWVIASIMTLVSSFKTARATAASAA